MAFVLAEVCDVNSSLGAIWPQFPSTVTAPTLTKVPGAFGSDTPEVTPFMYQGRPLLYQSNRQFNSATLPSEMYLTITNLITGQQVAQPFGYGYGLGCAIVAGNEVNVFAADATANNWFQDIYRFASTDMVHWTKTLAVPRSGNEHLLNSSVAPDPQGYFMAYETDSPVHVCVKFARSTDLTNWQKVDGPVFAGAGGTLAGCPVTRYSGGYYYAMYFALGDGQSTGQCVTDIARSKDLITWEYSEKTPFLAPIAGEGINNSDVDLFEYDGKTYVFYLDGDQATWGENRLAVYDGSMSQFLGSYFPAEVPEPASCVLLIIGLAGLLAYARRKRK